MQGFIRWVEKIGNKLPNPFMIFVWLILIVIVFSVVLSNMGISVTYLPANSKDLVTVVVKNLLDPKELHKVFSDFVKIYKDFAPLGLVMVMMMGVGFIECTGWISALMRKLILGAPRYLVTAILAFVGINANLASDAGMILAASVGGALFKAIGRNPMIGIILGFVSASGGFTANLMVAGTDALLAGITESAMKGVGIVAPSNPLINWYFMIVATFVLTIVATLVTEKFIVKTFGDESSEQSEEELAKHRLTSEESKGLTWSGIAAFIYIAAIVILSWGPGAFFANSDGSLLPRSPLISSIVPLLFFLFAVVGITYGVVAGTIKNQNDVVKHMQKSLSGSVSFMVVALPAALFIHLFNVSGITTVLAVSGAEALEALNLNGIPLLIMFIILCTLINLFMTSGSAKWLILAPIFVPMFAMGATQFSPALTQVAYRIGDSATNIISPLNFYIPIIIGFMEIYKKEGDPPLGMGSVISMTLPYSIAFLIALVLQLIIWVTLGLPLGPGAGLYL